MTELLGIWLGWQLVLGVACDSVTVAPGAAEASVPAMYRQEAARFVVVRRPIRVTPRYVVWDVRFPSPVVTADPENNTVPAEYFAPLGPGRKPAVVVLHILGADFALSRYVAARLADQGVGSLFIKLPYYGERRPNRPAARKFLTTDITGSTLAMRQGVLDVRRGLAWLATRPEVDPDRLGVCGISLGGIISALAASVAPEISQAALLLAGGHLDEILWDMPEPEARRYREMWLQSGRTRADLAELTRPYDPLTYAQGLRGKRVLMIAGRVDEVIPPRSAQDLWKEAGQPEIIWYDCGHYSAVGFLLPAIRQTVTFFARP